MGKWSTYSRRGGGSAAGVVETYQLRIAAAGGSISAGSLAAVAALYQALAIAGVWDKLIEVWPCVGNNLVSALVKLKVTPGSPTSYTNVNFVGGDYVESGGSGGLTGNGTTKLLSGGPSGDDLGQSASMYASLLAVTVAAATMDMLSTQVPAAAWRLGSNTANASVTTRLADLTGVVDNNAMVPAGWGGNRPAANSLQLWKNGVLLTSNATAAIVTANANRAMWFALNNNGVAAGWLNGRLAGGTAGIGLTNQNMADLHAAWVAFNTTIGR